MPDITTLATNTSLNAVKNKIPNVTNLVNKSDNNTKVSEIQNKIATDHEHNNSITTQQFNKLTAESFFKQK